MYTFGALIGYLYQILFFIPINNVLSFPVPHAKEQRLTQNIFFMEKLLYEQPQVEVIEISVEQGFAASGGAGESPVDTWASNTSF